MSLGSRRRPPSIFWRMNSTCTVFPTLPDFTVLDPDIFFSRYFCVGVSTACSIVNNMDKLMVATKELVGEQYHIHGIGIVQKGGYEPPTPGSMYPAL
jgi:hypothetical protein